MKAITIVGTVGKDSEIRENQRGQFVSLSVAVNRGYKREDGTDWFQVTYWNPKVAEWIKKGTRVTASGSLSISEREHDGQTRTYYNVNASQLDFFTPRKNEEPNNSFTEHDAPPPSGDMDDEIPF